MSIQQIKDLEIISRQLEPNAAARLEKRSKVVEYAEGFLNNINDMNAYVLNEDMGKGIFNSPISEESMSTDEALSLVYKHIDTPGLNPASGGHLGYIPGGGIYYAALGDYLADISNRYAGVFFGSPGAVRMENMLVDWLAEIVGYPKNSGGNLASGGSIANLTAIVTARDAHHIKARDIEQTVVYLSDHTHHCVDKALRIAGLKECIIRHVPLDKQFRIDTIALANQVAVDKKSGLKPWLVIASAGTTDVGAIDPLNAIADICEQHKLWFHVDGAYGAFFILTEEGREKLKGIERSDSLVMDPHKGLFLPYGLGALLVKNKEQLHEAHSYVASYMQDAQQILEESSPAEMSPELTKHFRGMRMWLPLKLHGLAPFRACLEEKLLLARYFYEQLQKVPGFELGPFPELSVVTFRYMPKNGDVTAFNERLVKEIHKDGRVFLSSSVVDGKFIIRCAILSFRTHLDTINLALEVLKEKVAMLEEEGIEV
jgi:glutamate/tyrosine decarboxylase-like PLP-dependent enzyme